MSLRNSSQSPFPFQIESGLPGHEYCLDAMGTTEGNGGVYTCHRVGGNQLFIHTKTNQIKMNNLCLDVGKDSEVKFKTCMEHKKSQEWLHNAKDKTLQSVKTGTCLAVEEEFTLAMEPCNGKAMAQKWLYKDR